MVDDTDTDMTPEDFAVRDHIHDAVSDLVGKFLYYDRKEDEDLPRGAIEDAIKRDVTSIDDIVEEFRKELKAGIK